MRARRVHLVVLIRIDRGDASCFPRCVPEPSLIGNEHPELDQYPDHERYERQGQRELDGRLPALIAPLSHWRDRRGSKRSS